MSPFSDNNRPGVEGNVGHWSFKLKRDPNNENEVWTFQCALCGYKTRHRVSKANGYILPLSGRLHERRRGHDCAMHPDQAREQDRLEKILLGRK
jgi:hypothetical protein